ncbi:hypothetical protein HG530_009345 [Fusarium avenaceum]|nr:hypothetical protein HG530_009345 [Fusarium avenaceum]
MTVEHQAGASVATTRGGALCAHTPNTLQETPSSISAQLVLLLQTSAVCCSVEVEKWFIDTDTRRLVHRDVCKNQSKVSLVLNSARRRNDIVDEAVGSILKRKRFGRCIEVHIVDSDDAKLRDHSLRIGLEAKLVVGLSKNSFEALETFFGQISSISNVVVSCHVKHPLLPHLLLFAAIQNTRELIVATRTFRQIVRKPLGSFEHTIPVSSSSLLELLIVNPLATDKIAQH